MDEELIGWARALGPLVARRAAEIEERRRLTEDVLDALLAADVFRLLVPAALGGRERPFPEFMRIVELLAQADASTAWCVNQGGVFATMAAWCDPDGAHEIWSDERCAIANGTPPPGTATRLIDGFRVDGRWSFSSGCDHATWIAALARLDEGDPADVRFFFLPRGDVRFHDTWDVRGLRGTGSYDFSVTGARVPERRSVTVSAAPPHVSGPLYVIRPMLLFACGFAAVSVGLARAALDDALTIVRDKRPRYARIASRADPLALDWVGRAEARWGAARAFLFSTVGEVWDAVAARGAITVEERVRLRMAGTHCIRECAAVVERAYDLAGTDGIHEAHPLQRRFQDMHVVAQHVQARRAMYPQIGEFYVTGKAPETPHI